MFTRKYAKDPNPVVRSVKEAEKVKKNRRLVELIEAEEKEIDWTHRFSNLQFSHIYSYIFQILNFIRFYEKLQMDDQSTQMMLG